MKTNHLCKVARYFMRGILKLFVMKVIKRSRWMLLVLVIITMILLASIPYTVKFEKNVLAQETEPIYIPVETFTASVSAYTSREAETDDTPFITANGDHVYDGGVACPGRYKFGTKVLINERVYKCNDRMNKRYRSGNYFDIWFPDYGEAIKHGRRQVEISIVE